MPPKRPAPAQTKAPIQQPVPDRAERLRQAKAEVERAETDAREQEEYVAELRQQLHDAEEMLRQKKAALEVATRKHEDIRREAPAFLPGMSPAQVEHHRNTITQKNCGFSGRCHFGTRCKFHHQLPNWPACTGVSTEVTFECCVCGEGPQSDPKLCYGVLDCCDHPICYSCVKEWRGQKSHEINCPMCREPIKYFFRSSRRLVGQERELGKEITLATWNNTPCRSYVANGRCPHRKRCHYKHPHPWTGQDLRPTEGEPHYSYGSRAIHGDLLASLLYELTHDFDDDEDGPAVWSSGDEPYYAFDDYDPEFQYGYHPYYDNSD